MSHLRTSETDLGSLFYTCPTLRFWTARRAKHPQNEYTRTMAYLAVSVSGGGSEGIL